MIAAIRIAGQAKQKKKDLETMKRLKLGKKFTCILVDDKDAVRIGMIEAGSNCIAYGSIPEELAKEIKEKRGKKDSDVFHLHPPLGGFKKSSKVAAPKGILGKHEDISKLIKRML